MSEQELAVHVHELVVRIIRDAFPSLLRFQILVRPTDGSTNRNQELEMAGVNPPCMGATDILVRFCADDFRQMTQDEQIGCLAHELAHVEDFVGRKYPTLSLLHHAFSARQRLKNELIADRILKARGFGEQMAAFLDYAKRAYPDGTRVGGLSAEELAARSQ